MPGHSAHLTVLCTLSMLYVPSKLSIESYGAIVLGSGLMARPYTDPVEIITAPIPAQSPFIPVDAKIVVGAVAPASPDPIPIVLLPGFEYRVREWRHPSTHQITGGLSGESPPSTAKTTSSPPERPSRTVDRRAGAAMFVGSSQAGHG